MDFDFLKDRARRARRMIPALEEYIRRHYVEEKVGGGVPPAAGAGMAEAPRSAAMGVQQARAKMADAAPPMAAASMNAAMPMMSKEEATPEKREARPAKYMAKLAEEPKKEEKKAKSFDFFGNALDGVASKRRYAKESAPLPLEEIKPKGADFAPEPLFLDDECDYSVCADKEEWDIEAHENALKERMTHLSDTYQQYLFYLIQSKGMSNAEVYKRAIVDKKTFAKIKANEYYHPAKLTALQLCVGAKLNLDETRDLLARAGYALSPCDKTDVIFSYFIENGIYDMIEIDIQLEEHGEHCIVV